MRRCRARSRRPWRRRCGLAGSAVLRRRPSGRPLRCCCCSSRACWPFALCCTAVAERGCIQHKHHGCCWLVLVLVHHEQLHRGVPGPVRLARRARARRQGRLCRLAWTPTTPCCSRTCGVRGLRSWPACSARGERPPRDLSRGVRIVGAGSELLGWAAPADELGCCCGAAGQVARARLLFVAS